MKRSRSPKPPEGLFDTISYFSFFTYAPDFDHIFAFLPVKTGKKELSAALARLETAGKLISASFPGNKNDKKQAQYTLPQYRIYFNNRASRGAVTKTKLARLRPFLGALARLPVIRFVGVTGSASMDNCKDGDDVDLCIVTSPNLLFTGRFLAILLSRLFGVRNTQGGACLNLFFDEQDLIVPAEKRTGYVAHELLQMKPLMDKDGVHDGFLRQNRWVHGLFPNSPSAGGRKTVWRPGTAALLLSPVEALLRRLQLRIIKKNRTGHLMTQTQLWLFRKDFGETLEAGFRRYRRR